MVIGLDGATFDLILPWIRQGKLPFLSELLKNGVYANLQSTIPMFTATAWSSFITGKNPGKHGITGFFSRVDNSYNVTLSNVGNRKGEEIWTILSDAGKRVIVMNVPLTYPPKKVNGCMITGMMTPSNSHSFTYPPSLKNEIHKMVGEYRVHSSLVYEEGREETFISEMFQMTEMRAETALYLMRKFDWDFFMIVFNETDQIQHALWKYLDPKHPMYDSEGSVKYTDLLLSYFQKMDDIIRKFASCVDKDTTIIVVSDHGFGPLYKFIHVNIWLMKLGFLRMKRRPITQIKYLLHRFGITPEKIYNALMKMRMGKVRARIGRGRGHDLLGRLFLSFSDVDWDRTRAYSLGAMGQIFVNLKGREPKGTVSPGKEYKQLRKQLISSLYELKDPDMGKTVVEKVYRKEEVYSGPFIDRMPDIVFVPNKGYIGFEEFEFASNRILTSPKGISGTHRLNGLFIMAGSGVIKGKKLKTVKIEDLAPTILYVLNAPILEDMDGEIIAEAFEEFSIPRLLNT